MVKLVIPTLCFLLALFCAGTAKALHVNEMKPPMSFKQPWRVYFAYLDGASIKYGWMTVSWESREKCEWSRQKVHAAIKMGLLPIKPLGTWCRIDGVRT